MFELHIIFGGLGKTQASTFGIAGSGMHNTKNMFIWLKGGT